MNWWGDWWEIVVMVVILIVVILLMAIGVMGFIHFSSLGEVEQYRELKSMVIELGDDARTEDILGKVADWNMKIADAKRYNKIPVIELWIPDRIANLKPIIIPQKKKK